MSLVDWQSIVDALAEAVVVADAHNEIVYLNEAAEQLLGWRPEELVGVPLTTIIPERFRAMHLESFARYAATGASSLLGRPVRLPALRSDGTEVGVELVVSGIRLLGEPLVVGLLRDVADRLELEGPADLSDRIVAILAETATLEEAWPRVLEALVESLRWDVAQLWLHVDRAGMLRRTATWARADRDLRAFDTASDRVFLRGQGLPGRVWAALAPVWTSDLSSELIFPRAAAARDAGLRTGFAFPLTAGRRLMGVVELFSIDRRGPNPDLSARLRDLGRELGWFLDRRSSEEQRLALATALQQSLLPPHLPQIPGVRLAARYLPAGQGSEVGGDFYDVFRIGRSSWGAAIGDVCGKGAEAAAVTALARHTIRAAAMQERSPAGVLAALNEALLRQAAEGGPSRFVTASVARFHPGSDGLEVAITNGGHPLALVRRANGDVEQVGSYGTALGLLDDVDLRDTQISLDHGDVLVMVTDGVLEARRDGDQFGDDRLADVLRRTSSASAEAAVDAVLSDVMAFQRGHAVDDIALLGIETT